METKTSYELSDFKKFKHIPIGSLFRESDTEQFAAMMINRHIDQDVPLNEPVHFDNDLVFIDESFIERHGNRQYTLTKLSLDYLYDYQQSNDEF